MDCIICYQKIKNKVSLECSHELCLKCFSYILQTQQKFSCPMCRKNYNNELKIVDKKDIVIPRNLPLNLLTGLVLYAIF